LNPKGDDFRTDGGSVAGGVPGRPSGRLLVWQRTVARREDGRVITVARSRKAGAVILAGLTLSACSSQVCTLVGCQSSVLVDVSAVRDLGATQAGRVMVCVGDSADCALAEADKGQDAVPVFLPAGALPDSQAPTGPVVLRIKIMNPGKVLVEDTVSATFTSVRPNGESCGPVCWTTRVVATDRGVTALPVLDTASPST